MNHDVALILRTRLAQLTPDKQLLLYRETADQDARQFIIRAIAEQSLEGNATLFSEKEIENQYQDLRKILDDIQTVENYSKDCVALLLHPERGCLEIILMIIEIVLGFFGRLTDRDYREVQSQLVVESGSLPALLAEREGELLIKENELVTWENPPEGGYFEEISDKVSLEAESQKLKLEIASLRKNLAGLRETIGDLIGDKLLVSDIDHLIHLPDDWSSEEEGDFEDLLLREVNSLNLD